MTIETKEYAQLGKPRVRSCKITFNATTASWQGVYALN
jgi:hypothetical protein